MSLNKSFDGGQSNYYLPPINRNQSANLPKTYRSQSHNDIKQVGQLHTTPVTRKLIATDNLRNIEQYEEMNQKQLLREHQNLLKVLKKYQQLIDINLAKKQKQKEKDAIQKARGGQKKASKQQVMNGQINNNKKIIANYLREIKDLQNAQKHRKLHQVLDEKAEVNQAISKIKKQIFSLKNQDTMASRNLVTDRGQIQKQLKDAEKDLKTQLTRNAQYKKRIEELNNQLKSLKKECQHINMNDIAMASHQKQYIMALSEKKMEIQQAHKNYARAQQSIQQVIVNKTKRNNGLTKEIDLMEKKMTEYNTKIASYKEKVSRYHKVLQKK